MERHKLHKSRFVTEMHVEDCGDVPRLQFLPLLAQNGGGQNDLFMLPEQVSTPVWVRRNEPGIVAPKVDLPDSSDKRIEPVRGLQVAVNWIARAAGDLHNPSYCMGYRTPLAYPGR